MLPFLLCGPKQQPGKTGDDKQKASEKTSQFQEINFEKRWFYTFWIQHILVLYAI